MTQRAPIYTRIGPREHPRSLLTWTNGVQQGLQPTPFIPRQWDWPNPVRAKISNDLRTWINDIPQEALSLTIPAGQKQRDWPNPTLRRSGALTWTNGPQITTAVVASLPFNQSNWPNPPARAQSYDPRTWIEGIPQTALSLTLPLRQTEWPNPVTAKPSYDLRTWIDGIPQAALSLTIPDGHRQKDWTNPVVARPNLALRTWTSTQQIPAAVAATMPIRQTEWPNPVSRAARLDLRTWVIGVQQGLQPTPFIERQQGWPNPIRRRANVELFTWSVKLQIPQPVAKPFSQIDWQNPYPKTPNAALRTWIQGMSAALLAPEETTVSRTRQSARIAIDYERREALPPVERPTAIPSEGRTSLTVDGKRVAFTTPKKRLH